MHCTAACGTGRVRVEKELPPYDATRRRRAARRGLAGAREGRDGGGSVDDDGSIGGGEHRDKRLDGDAKHIAVPSVAGEGGDHTHH